MTLTESVTICKSLADASRMRLMHALRQRPHYVEELSERFGLSPSTVSFHLKKLERAKLARHVKDQYYVMYHANHQALRMTLDDLLAAQDGTTAAQDDRLRQYRRKVMRTFFHEGRLERLPAQQKKRRMILEELSKLFETGRQYAETDVNAVIEPYYDDYCTIRREMVEAGLLRRERGIYWRTADVPAGDPDLPAAEGQPQKKMPQEETPMNRRKALIRAYKENPPPAGIFRITNTANGKILVGKGLNVQGKLNGQQAQLEFQGHRNAALQADWNEYGPEAFTFEVLDSLDEPQGEAANRADELAALEQLWLEKLQPYGERGYNRPPKK